MSSSRAKFRRLKSHQNAENEGCPSESSGIQVDEPAHANRNECGLIMIFPDTRAQAQVREVGSAAEETFAVDIVAVHGVNGDAYKTWTHKNGKLWLRDFLPNQIPGARIFSFQYDSKVAFSRSFGAIPDFALSLLNSLQGERPAKEQARKIIFICHSMGGIVVKKALIIANENRDNYGDILQSTCGLLFFGTPHRGSDTANFPKILSNAANVALPGSRWFSPIGRFRSELLKALTRDSKVLEEISTSFTQRTVGLKIVTFYEQVLTTPLRIKVVDKTSAVMGVANEVLIPFNADHREICRFESQESLRYKSVWQKIKEIVGEKGMEPSRIMPRVLMSIGGSPVLAEVGAVPGAIATGVGQPLTENEKKCLQCLYSSDYASYKLNIPSRVDGTCIWFLKHQKFRVWLASTERQASLLWVSGDPGCGKTVLSSFLVDHLNSSNAQCEHPTTICYFFCDDKIQGQKTANAILRGLLHQIITKNPSQIKHMMPDFGSKGERIADELATLWSTLVAIAASLRGNTICIIDALDECDESTRGNLLREMTGYFTSASKASSSVHHGLKVLATSRPLVSIEDCFRKVENVRLRAEDEAESISKDVALVVASRVSHGMSHWPETTRAKIHNVLADRTFLWISLVLQIMENSMETSEEALERVLTELPEDLDHVYDKILSKIKRKDQQKATKILQIIVTALRPLTLREIGMALSIEPTDRSFEDVRPRIQSDVRRFLQGLCGPFLRVANDSVVYLVHQTAKEFLTKAMFQEPSWNYFVNPIESNSWLASICIQYLLFPEFERPSHPGGGSLDPFIPPPTAVHRNQDFEFLDYAATFWLAHFQGAYTTESTILGAVAKLLGFLHLLYRVWKFSWYQYVSRPIKLTNLALASFLGLDGVVRLLLSNRKMRKAVNRRGGFIRTPLSNAAELGHENVVRVLLENGAKVNSRDNSGKTPLLWAAEKGYEEVVKVLLENGAEVDSRDTYSRTPLSWAVQGERLNTMRVLLENGADVDSRDTYDRTPLSWAVQNERLDTMSFLLENGADVDLIDGSGETLLLLAAMNGRRHVAKVLLENGARVDLRGRTGKTPLCGAAAQGHRRVVRLLLESGAEVDIGDVSSRTPLSWAAGGGKVDVVKMLLKSGAEVDPKDITGKIPLSWAAAQEHEGVVRLLLENGAKVGPRDKSGRTSLSLAAGGGNADVVKLLLESDAEVGSRDDSGRTPLSWAAVDGGVDVVKMLLESGAEVGSRDKSSRTPLSWAAVGGKVDVVKMLLENGAEVDSRDNSGRTQLSWAAGGGDADVVKLLLESGAEVGSRDDSGRTPLSWAAGGGKVDVVKMLLESGAEVGSRDKSSRTPLSWAAGGGKVDVVGMLLESGAEVGPRDDSGRTPLSWAAGGVNLDAVRVEVESRDGYDRTAPLIPASNPHTPGVARSRVGSYQDAVKMLLRKGAEMESRDNSGRTPLSLAAGSGDQHCVLKVLLENGTEVDTRDDSGRTPLSWAAGEGMFSVLRVLLLVGAEVDSKDNSS